MGRGARRTHTPPGAGTALIQISRQHGRPVTPSIADTEGGVLVTMGQDRDWLDRAGGAGQLAPGRDASKNDVTTSATAGVERIV